MNEFQLFVQKENPFVFAALEMYSSDFQMNAAGYIHFLKEVSARINVFELSGENQKVIELCDFLLVIANTFLQHDEKTQLEFVFHAHLISSNAYLKSKNFEKCFKIAQQGLDLVEQIKDDSKTAKITNTIGMMYNTIGNVPEAHKYLSLAVDASHRSKNYNALADAYDNISYLYLGISDYRNALVFNELALTEYRKLNDYLSEARNIGAIGIIYFYMNDLDRAKEYFQIAYDESVKYSYKKGMANWIGNLGNVHAEKGEYEAALKNYEEAMNLCAETQEFDKIGLWKGNIADLYFDMHLYKESVSMYQEAITLLEKNEVIGNTLHFRCQYSRLFTLSEIELMTISEAETYISTCLALAKQYDLKKEEYLSHSVLSAFYEKHHQWEKALYHHKEYVSVKQTVHSKEIEENVRNYDFTRRLQKIEEERSLELARLHEKELMLHDLLPGDISDRIINGEELVAELHHEIAIMFCDIVGFTEISERIGPEATIRSLNSIYTSFDSVIQKHGIEKIKTIGDCYMAASGLFDRESDYIHNIMKCACEILQLSSKLTFIDKTPLIVRIGIHAGTVMAGVLGDKKYTFDVWGDSVNTAARMESNGQPGSIHISDSIMNVIDLSILPQLKLLKEQKMYIKGKGEMKTALLSLEL